MKKMVSGLIEYRDSEVEDFVGKKIVSEFGVMFSELQDAYLAISVAGISGDKDEEKRAKKKRREIWKMLGMAGNTPIYWEDAECDIRHRFHIVEEQPECDDTL
jgi:hypothetical protein